MKNNTRENREAFGEILNAAAWNYKYQYSWKATGVSNDSTPVETGSYDASLRYCIDNHSVKDFKAYKVA